MELFTNNLLKLVLQQIQTCSCATHFLLKTSKHQIAKKSNSFHHLSSSHNSFMSQYVNKGRLTK